MINSNVIRDFKPLYLRNG